MKECFFFIFNFQKTIRFGTWIFFFSIIEDHRQMRKNKVIFFSFFSCFITIFFHFAQHTAGEFFFRVDIEKV